MNRKTLLFVSAVITVCIFYSIGSEYLQYGTPPCTLSGFAEKYLNTPQKYFYNGMIYGMPVIYAFSIPFIKPEIRIRMKKGIFGFIFSKCIIISVLITLYVILLSLICSAYFGFVPDFRPEMLLIAIRLTALYIQCNLLFYLFYTLSGNPVISIVASSGINLIFNILLLEYRFIVPYANEGSLLPFDLYIIASMITAFILLHQLLRRKELV